MAPQRIVSAAPAEEIPLHLWKSETSKDIARAVAIAYEVCARIVDAEKHGAYLNDISAKIRARARL